MKEKTIMLAFATLLIGSLCFWACQKDEIQEVTIVTTENILLESASGTSLGSDMIETKMVPFKGKGTWQAIDFSEPDFDTMEIEIIVKIHGTATHLGRLQGDWTGRYRFEVMLDEDDEPIIDPETGHPFIIPTEYLCHTTIYTAANGDELYDRGCNDYTPDDDGIGFVMKGVQINGGTGRFENAKGWYDIESPATVGFPYPGGTWKFKGMITRPGR